jgi:nucleoside-diphosphate-sugar epimerase
MTKVLTNKSGEIVVWGTGEEERDLLYISDLVEFVELALDKQKEQFELVNVGLGSSISINDLVSKIIQKSGKSIKIKYDVSKPTIKTKLFLDITKAYRIFEWKPQISLEEGIQRTIIWYKNNIKTE